MAKIKTEELCILISYAYEEISIGKARELLGWKDAEIRQEAEARCASAQSIKNRIFELKEENRSLRQTLDNWQEQMLNETVAVIQSHFHFDDDTKEGR